jgi:hypothetical protein
MKTGIIFTGLMICSTALFAQVEHDDMYFKKKDRESLNQRKEKSAQEKHAQAIARGEKQLRFDYAIKTNHALPAQSNQTNPEYIARSQSEAVAAEEQSYFLENYQYGSQIGNTANLANSGLWAGSPLFYNGYYLPQINGWNRSYYSAFDDPFFVGFNNTPWICNGFINQNSLRFNYGWDYHWGYGFGNRFYQWSVMWGNNARFWGSPYFGNSFYNNNIIIVENGNNGAVYGKRSSRAQNIADASANNNTQRSTRAVSYTRDNSTGVNSSGANVRQSSRSAQTEYFTPQWRRVTQQTSQTSTYNAPENRVNSSSSYGTRNATQVQGSSYSAPIQRSNSSSPSYNSTPSRSSSSGSSGGGSPSRSSRGGN